MRGFQVAAHFDGAAADLASPSPQAWSRVDVFAQALQAPPPAGIAALYPQGKRSQQSRMPATWTPNTPPGNLMTQHLYAGRPVESMPSLQSSKGLLVTALGATGKFFFFF